MLPKSEAYYSSYLKLNIIAQSLLIFSLISSSWSFINLLRSKTKFISLPFVRISYICVLLTFIHHIWLCLIIFNRSGDIEKNPGPKPNSYQSFSICHWNLNSITAHNFLKVSLLRAYITVHSFDVIGLSQGLISIHPFHMMIIIYKFQVIIYIG